MDAAAGPSGVDMKKKPMLDQVCEAIQTLGKPRIGASVISIKKHILDSYDESQHGRMFNQIKKAIIQGEESGMLIRPARCKNSVGATGSFLVKGQKSKTEVNKSEKHPEEKVKKMKKLFESEGTKVVQKTSKSKTTNVKNSKKKEEENDPSEKTTKPKTTKAKVPKMEENEDAPSEKTTKNKTTKVKNLKKKEEENEDDYSEDFNTSTPKSSSSGEQKSVRPRALLKKAVKGGKNDTFTMKRHSSDSELTDVKQKTVQRKTLKEKPKSTTKNSKPGPSNSSKETDKPSQVNNEKKKTRRVLKSYNSDSVLMEK